MQLDEEIKIEEALWSTAAKVAMVGTFSPLELLDASDRIQLAALQRLAIACEEVLQDDKPRWQMLTDARTRTLLRLKKDGLLTQHASDARPAESDLLGLFLKKILLGEEVRPAHLSSDELSHYRAALQLAGPVVDRLSDTTWVNVEVEKRDAEAAVQILLPQKLIGRARQMKQLRQFVFNNTGLTDDFILWLTGVGGVGKSALLAQFVRELRRDDWDGIPVITIDFDRSAFYQGRLSSIFLEMSRQLELFRPQMSDALSIFRDNVRRNQAEDGSPSFHDRATTGIELLSTWKECLHEHLPLEGEVVVVFDTLEELASSDHLSLNELASWLMRLRAAGFPNLRPIFSGRAFSPEFSRGLPIHSQLELSDLTPGAAITLLTTMLRPVTPSEEALLPPLIDMLGGNPLMLKMLSVYLRGEGIESARALLADRSAFDRQFAQTFLYKRLLGRIRSDDPDLVKVAHPGLILRRVTSALVLNVLAGPCKLGNIDSARAQELFDKLSKQVWLVQSSGKNAVVHRKDLRRLMLQAMTATDSERATAVHASAMEYYGNHLDPVLTKEQQRIEYQYHRLFTSAAELPPPETIPAFVRALGDDLETLPPVWRARLKVDSHQRLLAAEIGILQEDESLRYASNLETQVVREAGFAASTKHSADSVDLNTQPPRVALERAQNAYESGEIATVQAIVSTAIEEFASLGAEVDSQDFTVSTVWRTAICTLRQSKRFIDPLDRTLTKANPQSLYRPLTRSSKESLSLGGAYFMLYRLHGANPTFKWVSSEWRGGGSSIESVASLRYWQLGGSMPTRPGLEVRLRLLCDLADEFASFNTNHFKSMALDRVGAKEFEQRIRSRGSILRYSLHELNRIRPQQGCIYIQEVGSLRPEDHKRLRGLTPEIYPLVRAAARKCAVTALVEFAEDLQAHGYWPSELAGRQLKKNLKDEREQWTSAYIEVVDRHGQLLNLVNHLIERGRGTRALMQVVRDYDSRIKDFFNPG